MCVQDIESQMGEEGVLQPMVEDSIGVRFKQRRETGAC